MTAVLIAIASIPVNGGAATHPDLIDRITGQDEAADNYAARYHAAGSLAREATHDKARRLIEWIAEPGDPLPPMAAAAIRHEAVNQLIKAGMEHEALADAIMSAFADHRQSEAWRDYCLQHLGTLLPLIGPERAAAAQDMLWQATGERTGALAGTALISLQRNNGRGVSHSKLTDRAAEMAVDTRYGGGTRATALQILAGFNDARALPPARAALESSRDVVLRLAALGVVGTMGEARDEDLVQRYTQSSIPVLRSAAVKAQEHLKQSIKK